MHPDERKTKFLKLKTQIQNDKNLPLRENATNLVLGVGDLNSKIFILGEAPGREEDLKGEPFVGRAGKLLDKLLESIGLERKNVFIGNMVFYRPPNNRPPTDFEILEFSKYLNELIKIVNPKIVITLGRVPLSKFLNSEKISQIHGVLREVEMEGEKLKLLPMYHPSAGLRNPAVKKILEDDFEKNKVFLLSIFT